MQVFNTVFKNKESFTDYCFKNKIPNSNKVLLQIFTGVLDAHYIENLIKTITQVLPQINIIGTSTDGEIVNEEVLSESTVLSFMVFEKTDIKIYTTSQQKADFQTAKSLIKQFEKIDEAKAAIVFADGLNTNGEVFLKAFYKYAPNIQIAGGLAGDNATFTQTYLFTKDGINESGAIAAVLYNPHLIVHTSFSFGWEEIGKELTVTKAVENIVYTIDNISATDIYKKYLGSEIEQKLPSTGIEFPLILNRNGNKIARAVVSKNEDGSLVFAGNIKKGDKVYLGYGNIDHILDNRFSLYNSLSNTSIESILIYSCMARKRLLGEDIKNEIIPLSKVAPTSGFFTYGEFYFCNTSQTCHNHLLNQTMTIMTLSEKENRITIEDSNNYNSKNNIQTVKALSHLISATSKELNELNKTLTLKVEEQVDELRHKDAVLYEQSKNAAMGEMIGNIAHQWRQPLSVISSGATGLILEQQIASLDAQSLERTCNSINKNAQYLSKTIDDFKNFIKGDKERVHFKLQDTIENFLSLVEPSYKKSDLVLVFDFDTSIELTGHPNELMQCFMNIFNNAKDALQDLKDQEKLLFISTYSEKRSVVIKFRDNAGGIAKNVLPRIFEPYFTTKHQSIGTGLGLHMTYNLIKQSMQGTIVAKNVTFNHQGKSYSGAEFTLTLPKKVR